MFEKNNKYLRDTQVTNKLFNKRIITHILKIL